MNQAQPAVRPDPLLDKLREWDSDWAENYSQMSTNPWRNGILPLKTVELICVALDAACTNLQGPSTRQHIRAALGAGATREEILWVLKAAAMLSIHSCSLGAPILLEEAKSTGVNAAAKTVATPACDQMHAMGQWNQAWDPFYQIDPKWTDEFFAIAVGTYSESPLPPKEVELLSVAFDASVTHMYSLGTRLHIRGALELGATMEEIMEVLKLCVSNGQNALTIAVPILAEEWENSKLRQ